MACFLKSLFCPLGSWGRREGGLGCPRYSCVCSSQTNWLCILLTCSRFRSQLTGNICHPLPRWEVAVTTVKKIPWEPSVYLKSGKRASQRCVTLVWWRWFWCVKIKGWCECAASYICALLPLVLFEGQVPHGKVVTLPQQQQWGLIPTNHFHWESSLHYFLFF